MSFISFFSYHFFHVTFSYESLAWLSCDILDEGVKQENILYEWSETICETFLLRTLKMKTLLYVWDIPKSHTKKDLVHHEIDN